MYTWNCLFLNGHDWTLQICLSISLRKVACQSSSLHVGAKNIPILDLDGFAG